MQINGLREFASQIASLNTSNTSTEVQSSAFLPALTQQDQTARDSLFLSNIGKSLSLNRNKSASLQAQEEEAIITNPSLKKADQALKKAEDILKKMHDLATLAAENTNLTDLDRVEIQIEIENLRENLANREGGVRYAEDGSTVIKTEPPDLSLRLEGYGNETSVLDRMRIRIMNGEEWNVREAYIPTREAYNPKFRQEEGSPEASEEEFMTLIRVEDDGRKIVYEHYTAGEWYAVDEQNILTSTQDENGFWKITDTGRAVPTVREVLERNTTVVVMDAESAAEGVTYLEQQINSVQKMRDDVVKISDSLAEKSAKGLDTKAIEGSAVIMLSHVEGFLRQNYGVLTGTVGSLTSPTDASGTFFVGGRVQDKPFLPVSLPRSLLEPPEAERRFDLLETKEPSVTVEYDGMVELSGEELAGVKYIIAGIEYTYGVDDPEIVHEYFHGI